MSRLICNTLVLISILIAIESCNKHSNEPDSSIIEFKGITTTDIYGQFTGIYDSTDWQQNDNWQIFEKQLFSDFDMYNYGCPIDSNNLIVGYPNPIVDFMFKLHLEKDSTTRVDFMIVNQKFETLISVVSLYKNHYRCVTCGGDLEQKVNGVISYIPTGDPNTKIVLSDSNVPQEN